MPNKPSPVVLHQRLWAVIDDLRGIVCHEDVFALGPDKNQVHEEARRAANIDEGDRMPIGWRLTQVVITEVIPE